MALDAPRKTTNPVPPAVQNADVRMAA